MGPLFNGIKTEHQCVITGKIIVSFQYFGYRFMWTSCWWVNKNLKLFNAIAWDTSWKNCSALTSLSVPKKSFNFFQTQAFIYFYLIYISLRCVPNFHNSVFKTKMTCTTSEIRNVTRKRRAISNGKLSVTFNGLPPVYSSNLTGFQYVPNPVVTDISPRFTFPR